MITVCSRTFKEPIECKNFDDNDEICNCVIQLKKLREGFVLVETKSRIIWMKRAKAIKAGYGRPPYEFQLGINIDGTGLDEPDWLHMHGNCLTQEVK